MESVVAPRCTTVNILSCSRVRPPSAIPIGTLQRHSRRLQCRAAKKGDREGGGINWDAEWKKAKARLPEVPVEDVSSRRSSPRLRTQSDKIRDQENAVLDIFSQESFFKVGGAVVVFLVLFFVFVIGPPDS